ncbi:MAG: peptide deformylase [Clostridia bacterium]|jgi:peptide deformylase
MAIRNIRIDGDEILRKNSKEVEEINERILILIRDMAETMYDSEGVGLAAPQVGVLKRIIVIDVGEGLQELINPKIVSESGEQCKAEGCLSLPGVVGDVKRPERIVVKAVNMKGEKIKIKGNNLLAIALSHEIDHLNGILFKDKATNIIDSSKEDIK